MIKRILARDGDREKGLATEVHGGPAEELQRSVVVENRLRLEPGGEPCPLVDHMRWRLCSQRYETDKMEGIFKYQSQLSVLRGSRITGPIYHDSATNARNFVISWVPQAWINVRREFK